MVPDSGQKLALVMVGLPARGKTFVARKLQRYLSWLGYRTLWVNVGDYRRARAGAKQPAAYFAPDNAATREERAGFAMAALDDLLDWFAGGGEVGIYDATNTERSRRDLIQARCAAAGVRVVFVETICDDPAIVEANVRRNKLQLPDYAGTDADAAFQDFLARIAQYQRTYEPVQDSEGSYVKVVDAGQKVIVNRIEGYLSSRLAFFLMQIRPTDRPIWLTRHGESRFNVLGRIGGDAPLTERGSSYAHALASFIAARPAGSPVVWTSTLQRTIATAAPLGASSRQLRALDEIDAGVCDGLTYQEIREQMEDEFSARARDKFRYRYPRGESYADVIQRLEPVIVELERQRSPVLVIAHQAVIRALYGYLMGRPQDECPYIQVPLHTVVELTPTETGYDEQRYSLLAQ
ncbi:MAG TPA: 6-phosphofructo-2-kinase/fructose-2,6-bisphosphatase [Polyangiaceae bacterium]|nr:6-phosphofructo-2-kinase/fructose-2,6-bisphosphatase [Polyangiaceae bacterium]